MWGLERGLGSVWFQQDVAHIAQRGQAVPDNSYVHTHQQLLSCGTHTFSTRCTEIPTQCKTHTCDKPEWPRNIEQTHSNMYPTYNCIQIKRDKYSHGSRIPWNTQRPHHLLDRDGPSSLTHVMQHCTCSQGTQTLPHTCLDSHSNAERTVSPQNTQMRGRGYTANPTDMRHKTPHNTCASGMVKESDHVM